MVVVHTVEVEPVGEGVADSLMFSVRFVANLGTKPLIAGTKMMQATPPSPLNQIPNLIPKPITPNRIPIHPIFIHLIPFTHTSLSCHHLASHLHPKITLLNPILTHLLKPMLPAPHQTAGIQILEHLTMSPMSPKTFSKSLLLRVQTKLPLVMVKGFLLIPEVIQNLFLLLIPMFLFVL